MTYHDIGHNARLLTLSQETGKDVLDAEGQRVGRLADLFVNLDKQSGPQLVQRLLVRRRPAPDLYLPWSAIEKFEHSSVVIRRGVDPTTFSVATTGDVLGGDEILLVRDVLDTQVVDVVGQRLARVADVVLSRAADSRLELAGVEVGFGGVLRRLGLPGLAVRARSDFVAWADLHLTSERGHTVQLATPRSAIHHLDAAGLAALVSRLDTESAAEVLAAEGPQRAAGVIRAGDPVVGERMLRALPVVDAANIVAAMPVDHATRWRARLARKRVLRGRLFIRSRVWRRRRHPGTGEST